MKDRTSLMWKTSDGRDIKIIDMETSHICNTINHIEKHKSGFIRQHGKKLIDEYIHDFNQEIRYRKLNRLNNEDSEELF